MVVGDGFEPSKAKPADLQSAPVGHLGNLPRKEGVLSHTLGPVSSLKSGKKQKKKCQHEVHAEGQEETERGFHAETRRRGGEDEIGQKPEEKTNLDRIDGIKRSPPHPNPLPSPGRGVRVAGDAG